MRMTLQIPGSNLVLFVGNCQKQIFNIKNNSTYFLYTFCTINKCCTFINALEQKNPHCFQSMLKCKIQLKDISTNIQHPQSICQKFFILVQKMKKHTSSLSCLLKGRRTKSTGSILPGGRPMPNKIINLAVINKHSKGTIYWNHFCIPRTAPILKRAKS